MKIQQLVNSIFRQNFKDPLVLGRSVFAVAILAFGFDSIFNVANYVSYAPSYIKSPVFFIIFVGVIFLIAGFFILANVHLKKATNVLISLFVLFIVIVYLPMGDTHSIIQSLGFIGATLLIRALPTTDTEDVKET